MNKSLKIILSIFVILVYFFTLPRSIGFGDSGTMAAAAVTLGVPHPPGFPVYLILSHLLTLLPFGTMLWKLQILSIIPAIGIIWLMPSIFTSLATAFFYIFWSQATGVESFMLTNLFIFTIINLITSSTPIWIIGLLLGFGAGLNPIGVVVVPILLYVYRFSNKFFQIICIATPLAIIEYTYVPLRAATHQFINWGNPSTIPALIHYLSGSGLSINSSAFANGFTGSISWLIDAWIRFGYLAWNQLSIVVIALAFWGAWQLWQLNRPRFWIWIILIITNISLAGIYVSGNRDIWLMTSLITLIILAGEGIFRLVKYKWVITCISLAAILYLSAPVILSQNKTNISGQYINDLYLGLPQDSIIIGGGETFNAMTLYASQVANIRKDVTPIDMTIFYGQSWYRDNLEKNVQGIHVPTFTTTFSDELEFSRTLEEFASKNTNRPIFITGYLLLEPIYANSRQPAYIPQTYHLQQNGIVYQLTQDDSIPIEIPTYPSAIQMSNLLPSNASKAISSIAQEYALALERTGDYLMSQGNKDLSFAHYNKAMQLAPKYFDQNRLGTKVYTDIPR